jgi:hypothetical protein
MVMSHHQNAGDHNLRTANKAFQNVTKFKYSGRTVRNENLIHGEIKRRFNSGNACYHSVKIQVMLATIRFKLRECLLPFSSESFVIPPLL